MGFTRLCRNGIGAAVLVCIATATASRAETLPDALVSAYNNSGLLEQNRALLRAADEDVAQAVATLRPVLNYAATAGYSKTTSSEGTSGSLGLSADMLLYDFGNSQLAIDAAKETVLATREALVGVEQQVLLRAAAAYLGVRREEAFVGLRGNNVRVITEQLRAARDRFEVGEVTRTDVSIAEARLAAAQSGLAAAQGALTRAQAEYEAATGRRPGRLASPPRPPATASSLAAAKSVAFERHPDIRRAQREVKVAELNALRASTNFRPRLSADAGLSVDDEGDDSASVGLSLRGPIYQGGQLSSLLRAARARRDAARAGLYTTQQSVEQNVDNAWANLQVAGASLSASQQQVAAARLALRGAQEEFEVGSRTTLDVLDREQELLDAQTNAIAAGIDQNLAAYQLLSAMGLLTADHLGLGVVAYDPAAYYNAVKDAPRTLVSPQGQALDRVLKSLGKN